MSISRRSFIGQVLGIFAATKLPFIGVEPTYKREPVTGLILPQGQPTLITDGDEIVSTGVEKLIVPEGTIERQYNRNMLAEFARVYGPQSDIVVEAVKEAIKYGSIQVQFNQVHPTQTFTVYGIKFHRDMMFSHPVCLIPGDILKITATLNME